MSYHLFNLKVGDVINSFFSVWWSNISSRSLIWGNNSLWRPKPLTSGDDVSKTVRPIVLKFLRHLLCCIKYIKIKNILERHWVFTWNCSVSQLLQWVLFIFHDIHDHDITMLSCYWLHNTFWTFGWCRNFSVEPMYTKDERSSIKLAARIQSIMYLVQHLINSLVISWSWLLYEFWHVHSVSYKITCIL